jgi:hypothetical protein
MPKTIIYFHRSYRKITGSGKVFVIEFITVSLFLSLLILFAYPTITHHMSLAAQSVLSHYYPTGSINVLKKTFLLGDISFLDIDGTYPTALLSLINFIVSLYLVIYLPTVKRDKNIAIYLLFLAAINLVSALFFTISPSEFPYTASEFSEFYIKSEISMWLFIPFILGLAVLLLPSRFFSKLMLILFAVVYSVVFGTLRYIIFLFIVSKFSVIYMALLFFAFGPLIDFIYIVGIYSYYGNRLAKTLKNNDSVWKWSY